MTSNSSIVSLLSINFVHFILTVLGHFSAPDFVNALEDEEHVYFFFREAAVEHINCGKVSVHLSYLELGWAIFSKSSK